MEHDATIQQCILNILITWNTDFTLANQIYDQRFVSLVLKEIFGHEKLSSAKLADKQLEFGRCRMNVKRTNKIYN